MLAKDLDQPVVYAFSDDPQWVKENIQLNFPTRYVDHNKGKSSYEDLRLMSNCKHQVIANSSFSWWAAWLNANENKKVIAPSKWFADERVITKDVYPEAWIRI